MELIFFFFNDTATTEIYTLSLHDALPICRQLAQRPETGARRLRRQRARGGAVSQVRLRDRGDASPGGVPRGALRRHLLRSEEHTSELQSRQYLVCRLLLEKKKKPHKHTYP